MLREIKAGRQYLKYIMSTYTVIIGISHFDAAVFSHAEHLFALNVRCEQDLGRTVFVLAC